MLSQEKRNLGYLFQKYFGSEFTAFFFLLFGAFCYFFSLSFLVVAAFVSAFVLTLLFCEDVKNIFAYLFYVPYFISNIKANDTRWGVLIPLVLLAAVSVIAFTVKQFAVGGKKLPKGGLFFPWIAYAFATLIGGLARFNPLLFAVLFGFLSELICFYFIAINNTRDLSRFLAKIFVVGALSVSLCMLWFFNREGIEIFSDKHLYMFAENVNTAAIFILLGIAGAFYLGVGRKYDYLYGFLCAVIYFAVLITQCRLIIGISSVALLAIYVLLFVYSENRKIHLWILGGFLLLIFVAFAVFSSEIIGLLRLFFQKMNVGLSGRKTLWPWCADKFTEYPYFGYGLISDEKVPAHVTFYPYLVMAHNTVLHWLTTSGIVGTAIVTYFYCAKYRTLFKGFNKTKIFHLLCVLSVALSGTFDQSPTTDFFVVILSFVLVAAAETVEKDGKGKRLY